MVNTMDKKLMSSKLSIDSDTVQLFDRFDIRAFKKRNQFKSSGFANKFFNLISVLLLVIISIAFIALVRLYYSYSSNNNDQYIILYNTDHISTESLNNNVYTNSKAIENSFKNNNIQCDNIEDKDKFDCNPDQPISESVCISRGCCWSQPLNLTFAPIGPPIGVPYCYYGNGYIGYQVNSIDYEANRYIVTLVRVIKSGFLNDALSVKLEVITLNQHTIRLRFYNPNSMRYEVPIPQLNINQKRTILNPLYEIAFDKNDGIFKIIRRSNLKTIFQVDLNTLVFSDQFLQLSSHLPANFIYGIGEHKDGFRKQVTWKRYTMFNRDQYPIENSNLYGSHAFHLVVEENTNGLSSGVFLFNSNAMDIILQPSPAITWRTIGGILDFFVFLGPKAGDVVQQYQQLIGLPIFPPYWSLGFHLCRFGYHSLDNLKATFERNRKANIPYDVQWTDIDAMKTDNDFSYDDKLFAGLPQFVEELHKIGMKYIPMFDPGISSGETPGTYPPFDDGVALDIFIKNSSGQLFEGKVWNRKSTVWVDFTNPESFVYWSRQFARYHSKVSFDGAWIDMNEPSNFYNGAVNGCPVNNSLEDPQYVPGMKDSLRTRTLCMTAQQYSGLHYDVHNLYGISEAIATNIALRAVLNKRPFIISRSTFAGHGHYASHWNGDILSTWESMRWTIPSILNFNLFGIPMIGADICGFNGNTTVELCARWQELGAFYPFSRNHNSDDCIDQDPAALGPVVIEAARNALQLRYALLPYLYTLFFRAHIYGETVVRPLFFEFPLDNEVYKIETQFLWGPSLMIVPVLYPNATTVNAYLPSGIWYDSTNYNAIKSYGQYIELSSPLTTINVVLRGGRTVAAQFPNTTTERTRKGDFILAVGLDSNGISFGELYWDCGDGLDNILLGAFNLFEFFTANSTLTSKPIFYGYDMKNKLKQTLIMGVNSKPNTVYVNGVSHNQYHYDNQNYLLNVIAIDIEMSKIIVISWS